MMPATVHVTDDEFQRLIGENILAFAARVRAEAMAYSLKERVTAVAADLRRWIAAGDVRDAASVACIADAFDHLALAIDNPVARRDLETSSPGAGGERYELETWHVTQEQLEAGAAKSPEAA